MSRGNNITPDEIKKIAFLHDRGLTHREIEDIVGRSDTAIGKIVAAYETTKVAIDLSDYKESTMYQERTWNRVKEAFGFSEEPEEVSHEDVSTCTSIEALMHCIESCTDRIIKAIEENK